MSDSLGLELQAIVSLQSQPWVFYKSSVHSSPLSHPSSPHKLNLLLEFDFPSLLLFTFFFLLFIGACVIWLGLVEFGWWLFDWFWLSAWFVGCVLFCFEASSPCIAGLASEAVILLPQSP